MQRTFARTGTCQLTPAPVRWRESCSAGAGAGARPRSAPSSRRRTCARPAPCVPDPIAWKRAMATRQRMGVWAVQRHMQRYPGRACASVTASARTTRAGLPNRACRLAASRTTSSCRGRARLGAGSIPMPRQPGSPLPGARRACAAPCAWRGAPRPLPPCATRFGEPTLPCPTPTLPAAAARGPRTARASVTGPPCPGVRLAPARPASKKITCARGARASTVSAVMRRNTVTGRACPMRCTRPIACCSTAGSTLGSSRNTLLAARAHPTLCNARQCVHD